MSVTAVQANATLAKSLALAVADVNWFTTESLFRELDDRAVSVLGLRCMDYLNGWRKGLFPWSKSCRARAWGPNSLIRDLILPSGWMKKYPQMGMRPISHAIRDFWSQCVAGAAQGLVMTYPHYLHLQEQLQPELSLYYNLDDYSLYWPRQAEVIRFLERQMVLRTGATVCVARARAEELRSRVPEAASRIHHIPHGTPSAFLAERPFHRPAPLPRDIAHLRRPVLGYVGSTEKRVDWALMSHLSEAFPDASLVVAGRTTRIGRGGKPWMKDWARFAGRPNVHLIGWRPQSELPAYYASFDAILIPYREDHPFNLACSPTKIMDGMGTGRPIVSTAIPECRQYERLFHVARGADAFVEAVRSIIDRGADDGRADDRFEYARHNTCSQVASRILALMVEGNRSST
jgi:glycosyltransferase involved in cell wall biosynthesis